MKKIVITGTSRGIGLELVKILAGAGHSVLALSRNDEPVKTLKLEKVQSLSCDLGVENDLEKASEFVAKEWEEVDILIHNAGAIVNKPFEEITSKEFEEVYKTNVFGVAALTQKMLPFMKKEGHVVTVSSMGGVQGSMKFPGLSAYSSSKGAVITLTELLAEEYKENGPSFNVLALGAVQTEMLAEAFPGYEAPVKPAEMAQYIADFALTGNKYFNGKLLQVSNSTP
ncbi:Short-chain dehydrogenase [Salinimicrobium catena]|uniref:Short-chain dehydrogenase n=1 Tax=Salinimicrobium catena TaxID=390640 RepID=A0A1H5NLP9_9FLAO|nr:SDR family oxidoreductase [Salinimicrobium catena]SDL48677.1 Short-chain dehydrogenase [Salinimicrobium catena]SEF01801.1 Short-chain dehydrogenase [Salinimicrobium catena]